jgi:hypothetical protein
LLLGLLDDCIASITNDRRPSTTQFYTALETSSLYQACLQLDQSASTFAVVEVEFRAPSRPVADRLIAEHEELATKMANAFTRNCQPESSAPSCEGATHPPPPPGTGSGHRRLEGSATPEVERLREQVMQLQAERNRLAMTVYERDMALAERDAKISQQAHTIAELMKTKGMRRPGGSEQPLGQRASQSSLSGNATAAAVAQLTPTDRPTAAGAAGAALSSRRRLPETAESSCDDDQKNVFSHCVADCDTCLRSIDSVAASVGKCTIMGCTADVCPKVTQISTGERGTTYLLSVKLSGNAKDVGRIYGTQAHPMILPPAFQAPAGVDIGGVNPGVFDESPEAEFDSWLTIALTQGNRVGEGDPALQFTGLDFAAWTAGAGSSWESRDGEVSWLNPEDAEGGKVQIENGQARLGEVAVAQLTVTEAFDAFLNLQGRSRQGDDWTAEGVKFSSESTAATDATTMPAVDIMCNSCDVDATSDTCRARQDELALSAAHAQLGAMAALSTSDGHVRACTSTPCELDWTCSNGGTCIPGARHHNSSATSFTCACEPGFSGPQCEEGTAANCGDGTGVECCNTLQLTNFESCIKDCEECDGGTIATYSQIIWKGCVGDSKQPVERSSDDLAFGEDAAEAAARICLTERGISDGGH